MSKKNIHFIGIGGTAMGSVAAAMQARGYHITGSDQKVYPPMSTYLESQGIQLMEGYHPKNIPPHTDLVVIGNAISRGNPEAEAVLNQRLPYLSLPEILKTHFLQGKQNFVVTGTHGKTTTTAILTWLMKQAKLNPSHMIGGIPKNFNKAAHFTNSDYAILEGDEYDTAFFDKRSKFLHYLPHCAIINNIEFDHADIYNSLEEIKLTFTRLLTIIPSKGLIILNGDDQNCLDILQKLPPNVRQQLQTATVGFSKHCDTKIEQVLYESKGSSFSLQDQRYFIPMVGEFNVRNAAVAIKAALFAGIKPPTLRKALARFDGIARRQELRGEINGIRIIDDFAHHPTAIREAIKGLRQLYPKDRLWIIFEPRSNTTRRNILQTQMAEALALADHAIIPSIENPEKFSSKDRLNPEELEREVQKLGGNCRHLPNVQEIITTLGKEAQSGDTIAILSNGGFDHIHDRLLQHLKQLNAKSPTTA